MARKSKRAALVLTPEQTMTLKELAGSRTAPAREVERAKVLLGYAAGTSITELQRQLGFSRPMIYRSVDKALAAGVQTGLKDKYHRPHEPEITDEAKAWVVSIACTKPKDHGLAAELWSISALARFVSEGAEAAGFARLANAGKSTVWRILNENEIKPHKIRYYLEKRDPEFDRKMQEVLMVYRDVSIYQESAVHDARPNPIYTVSVDEKPGVQAIGLTAPDLPPVPGKASTVGRDYEYVRRGTVSILAGIDLHSGSDLRQRRGPPPQCGVHRAAQAPGRVLSERGHHSRGAGQPFGPHLQGDHGLSRRAPRALRVRSHTQAWLLAQSDRVRLL